MLVVLPVGRVGSLFSCVSSLSLLLRFACCPLSLFLSLCLPLFTSRLIPLTLALSPRGRLPFSLTAAAHPLSQELLFDCFITFINAAATRCYYYHSSYRGGRFLCWSTIVHCCSQKDANFNLILSNIIYVCTRLEKPRTLFENCRIVAVSFFHSIGNHSHIHSDDSTPHRELCARLSSISRLCAFARILLGFDIM